MFSFERANDKLAELLDYMYMLHTCMSTNSIVSGETEWFKTNCAIAGGWKLSLDDKVMLQKLMALPCDVHGALHK
jgi:tetrahydromethanopterin S-methyltransferase subunit E